MAHPQALVEIILDSEKKIPPIINMGQKKKEPQNLGFPMQLGPRGRVVLPAKLRKRLGLQTGARLYADVHADGSFQVSTIDSAIEDLRGFLSRKDGRILSDELVKERRTEAGRDEIRS